MILILFVRFLLFELRVFFFIKLILYVCLKFCMYLLLVQLTILVQFAKFGLIIGFGVVYISYDLCFFLILTNCTFCMICAFCTFCAFAQYLCKYVLFEQLLHFERFRYSITLQH